MREQLLFKSHVVVTFNSRHPANNWERVCGCVSESRKGIGKGGFHSGPAIRRFGLRLAVTAEAGAESGKISESGGCRGRASTLKPPCIYHIVSLVPAETSCTCMIFLIRRALVIRMSLLQSLLVSEKIKVDVGPERQN